MGALQLAQPAREIAPPIADDGFNLHDLRVFTSIPRYHHDVVVLRGMVVVFETDGRCREGFIQEGSFYVRESQYPVANMSWDSWLDMECERRAKYKGLQPRSPLSIRREVVRAVRWPRSDNWALRLSSGFTDGPYHDWAFGCDLIGKVVGIYHPDGLRPAST